MDNKRYNILGRGGEVFRKISIKAFIPEPNEDDYDRGYLHRFFTQRANDANGSVYEISSRNYEKMTSNPFYNTTELYWKIKGTDDEIKLANSKSVKLASKRIPALSLYLPYLLQFKK
jgi:hypothetical protein